METTIKTKTVLIISFIILLLGLGLGFLIYDKLYKEPTPSSEDNIEEIIQPEKQKIDSLTNEIRGREDIINRLRDSLKNIKIIRIYEVDSIRKLPTTEGVEFLRNKLREFESKYREE